MRLVVLPVGLAILSVPAAAMAQSEPVPVAQLTLLVTPDDYPTEAMKLQQQGDTTVELLVGAKGKVKSCSVLTSSGSPSLDTATCRIMKSRARFRPATDAAGKPISGTYRQRMAWRFLDQTLKGTPLQAAFIEWATCLRRESTAMARTSLPLADIETRAFDACLESESRLDTEMTRNPIPNSDFPASMAELKAQYRKWIKSWVVEVR